MIEFVISLPPAVRNTVVAGGMVIVEGARQVVGLLRHLLYVDDGQKTISSAASETVTLYFR